MKAKTLLISAISLGLLISLTGCSENVPTVPSQTGTPNNPAQSAVTTPPATAVSSATVNILPGNTQTPDSTAPTTAVPQISQADQTAYGAAQKLGDPTFCDRINDETYKKSCKISLLDLQAQNEAIAKMDPTLCSKLSTKDAQESCKINIDAQSAASAKLNAEAAKNAQQSDLYNTIFESGNFDQCGKLTDTYYKDICVKNGIMNRVMEKKDIKICQEFGDATGIVNCEKSYKEMTAAQEKYTQQMQEALKATEVQQAAQSQQPR